jgi:hypothetical protein
MIGIALCAFVGVEAASPNLSPVVWFILFWQLTIAVHEGGHVLGGSLTGFTCRGVMICCYRLIRTMKGWRFGLEWKRTISGGFAYMMPSRLDLDDWRYGVMVAAGPASSVLWMAILLAVPWAWWTTGARLPALLAAGVITAVSLVPVGAGAVLSDTARLMALARGGDNWKRWKLVLRFQTLNMLGVPPREWEAQSLETAASFPGGKAADRMTANLPAYLAAVDRGEIPEASRFLEATLTISDQTGPVVRSAVFLEAASFQARRKKNAELARTWLNQAGQARGLPKYSRLSAEAAVLLSEGKIAAAGEKASSALVQLSRRAPDVATVEMAVRNLREILAEVQSARSMAAS